MTGPLAPVLTMIETGQARQFAYLHAAVYAGEHNGNHYVIENGGAEHQCGQKFFGVIRAVKIQEAYKDSQKPRSLLFLHPKTTMEKAPD